MKQNITIYEIARESCEQFFEAEYITPRLTTIDQQNSYLGKLSIMTLINAIKGTKEPINIKQNPNMIIRES